MIPGTVSPGVVVRLQDLHTPGSPFVLPNQSLRVVGRLERFDAVSGIAVLTDGAYSIHLDLQHLRELPLRVSSLFEFVGELELQQRPLQQQHFTLKARVGRNVDGRDMRIFDKVLQLRRLVRRLFQLDGQDISGFFGLKTKERDLVSAMAFSLVLFPLERPGILADERFVMWMNPGVIQYITTTL